jgi:putative tricarboxylic transport membrane protein
MYDNLLMGLSSLSEPMHLFAIILGVILGIIVGILPGLGSTAAAAIMMPITLWMTPMQALSMLGALYAASTAGGSITSILFRIPGESSSAVTLFDGFPMAKRGEGGRALGLSMTASAIGGTISAFVLMFSAPLLAKVALGFSMPEYFALCLFGMSTVTSLGGKSQLKGLISLCIGLFVVTIGLSGITGVDRFTFGSLHLRYGVNMVAIVVGLFGFSEFLRNTSLVVFKKKEQQFEQTKTNLSVIKDFLHMKAMAVRSILIGIFMGVLPGSGSTIASILAYNEAVRWSKHPEKFGTGIEEGVAAPEFANNAACGGALIPALTLGIPGSSTCAVILAAMISHGLTPGPRLFVENADVVWGFIAAFLAANVVMVFVGLLGIWVLAKVLTIHRAILNWIIFLLCVIGAFGINNNMIDVYIMFIFGFLGFMLEKNGFPLMPLVLGIILGPLAETSLNTGMVIHGSFWPFITRPVAGILLFLSILSVLFPLIRGIIPHKREKSSV